MTSRDGSPNCRQQSFLISAFSQNPASLLQWHLLQKNEAKLEFRPEFIQKVRCAHTKIELKFPIVDIYPRTHANDKQAMVSEFNNGPETSSTCAKILNAPPKCFLEHETAKERKGFYSARELLTISSVKKNDSVQGFGNQRMNAPKSQYGNDFNFSATKKSLGGIGRFGNTSNKRFVSPVCNSSSKAQLSEAKTDPAMEQLLTHPNLKNIDPKMVEMISNEIIHQFKSVDWSEIAGLHYAKSIIKEAVVYPLLRPDIFTGLRKPPRGILLFGPPGTGKTLIGKCIASQSSATFFSISSASLTSKWMGEGEKMVRALFAVAQALQPAVIFIDEIDSLLSQRSENENEGTRRLKTEFLVRLDGAATTDDDRVLIVGATNRPQELDEAVRRRFVKRLYVPLPELNARIDILTNLLNNVDTDIDANDLKEISLFTDGYSGADMDSLCREASMEPLRSLPFDTIMTFKKDMLRPVNKDDFKKAIQKIRPSVSQKDLDQYVEWNKTYGSSF